MTKVMSRQGTFVFGLKVAMRKQAPATIDKATADFLASLAKDPDREAAPEEWDRYAAATEANEKQWLLVTQTGERYEADDSPKNKAAFDAAMQAHGKTMQAMFGAYDQYTYVVAKQFETVLVPEDELRMLIKESISGNSDGVIFDLNYGMLAHQVALIVRKHAVEDTTMETPLCRSCGGS